MNFNPKKIDIRADIVEMFIAKYGDISVQKFCNEFLEKIIEGKLVELTGENYEQVNETADKIERDGSFVVNEILNRFIIVPAEEKKKEKVTVSAEQKKVRTKRRARVNQIANY